MCLQKNVLSTYAQYGTSLKRHKHRTLIQPIKHSHSLFIALPNTSCTISGSKSTHNSFICQQIACERGQLEAMPIVQSLIIIIIAFPYCHRIICWVLVFPCALVIWQAPFPHHYMWISHTCNTTSTILVCSRNKI